MPSKSAEQDILEYLMKEIEDRKNEKNKNLEEDKILDKLLAKREKES